MGRALPAGLCSETTSAIMKMLIIANLPHTFMYISSFDPHTTLQSGYPSTPPPYKRKETEAERGWHSWGWGSQDTNEGVWDCSSIIQHVWLPRRRGEHPEQRGGLDLSFLVFKMGIIGSIFVCL